MMQKNRLGNQKPTFDQYKNGDIWIAEKTIELLGRYYEPLLDWQRMVLRRWLAVDEDGKWSNPECVLTVPRQNGKTFLSSHNRRYRVPRRSTYVHSPEPKND